MKQVVEFVRTGDPWIDNGTVFIFDHFAKKYAKKLLRKESSEEIRLSKVVVTLSQNSMTLKGPVEGIRRLLDEGLEHLKNAVWGETKKGKMWWSGLARFFFKQQFAGPTKFLVSPDQLAKKSVEGTCDFCGRTGQVIEARTSEHPFLVKSDKMSSFYSQLRGAFNICVYCTFASWFAIRGAFFSIDWSKDALNAFFFDAPDLLHLSRLQYALGPSRAEEEINRNFKGALSYTTHPLENFIGFLLAVYSKMEFKRASTQDATVHVFSARLDNRKVSFTRYYTVPNLSRILQSVALMEWRSATKQHNSLEDVMKNFYFIHTGERETIIREEFARRFFTYAEIADVIEEFLFRRILSEKGLLSGFDVISLYQLMRKYQVGVLELDYHILNATKRLGDILGNVAAEKDDKSILYALRGLRSLEDYYAYLHQFATRHIDSLVEGEDIRPTIDTITSEISEKNWRNHRSLVGIYAVLKYVDVLNRSKKMKATKAT